MEELQKEAIMKNITYVVDNMNRQPIMDCLVESSVFTMTDVATVNAIGLIDEDKNRELIKILFRKGEDLKPYEHFIRALEKKHQKAIAAKIKNTHEELLHLPSAEASTTTTQPTAAASVPGTSGTDGNGKSVNREETTNDNIPTDGEDNVNRQTVVVEEKPSKRNRFCSAFLKWKYL
uniref:CARD domain-containing protein n=1 Tax=Plectus sambesii TaxID=2011161 RepID=A0A914VYY4_9BILA